MENQIWKQKMEDLDYDEEGHITEESFQNSFIGVLETEIKKFIASEYQKELGLKDVNE